MPSRGMRGIRGRLSALVAIATIGALSVLGVAGHGAPGAIPTGPQERVGILTNTAYITLNSVTLPGSPTAGWSLGFIGTSTYGTYTCSWTFGDGGTSNSCSVTHVYTTYGVFTVTLKTTSGSNFVSVSHSIGTWTGCTPGTACVTSILACDAASWLCDSTGAYIVTGWGQAFTSTGSVASATNWQWSMGDGSGNQLGQDISYTYSSSGSYSVTTYATISGTQYSASISNMPIPT
jgi:hypothetical protein